MEIKTKGNIFGLAAITLWSASALFVALSGTTPPFLIGTISGAICASFYLIRSFFIKDGIKNLVLEELFSSDSNFGNFLLSLLLSDCL